MRDEDRIRLYYDFGVLDWRSEEAEYNRMNKNTNTSTQLSGLLKIFTSPNSGFRGLALFLQNLLRRQIL